MRFRNPNKNKYNGYWLTCSRNKTTMNAKNVFSLFPKPKVCFTVVYLHVFTQNFRCLLDDLRIVIALVKSLQALFTDKSILNELCSTYNCLAAPV